MSEKTEAQRLADALTRRVPVFEGVPIIDVAAAELRRLEAANAELLDSLQSISDCCDEDHAARDYASRQTEIRGIARYAIAKHRRKQ